jgi:hypothetical protein
LTDSSPAVKRICGWQKACDVPYESSFSRAFKAFSESGLIQITHGKIIKEHMGDEIIGYISRDSTFRVVSPQPQAKHWLQENRPSELLKLS